MVEVSERHDRCSASIGPSALEYDLDMNPGPLAQAGMERAVGASKVFDGGFLQGFAHVALVGVRESGALDEQDDGELSHGIDPGLGAIGAAMAEAARAEGFGDAGGGVDDVEAEAHVHARAEAHFQVAGLVRGHLLQRFGFQELMLLSDKSNHLRMVLPGKTESTIRTMRDHMALLEKEYDIKAYKLKKAKEK